MAYIRKEYGLKVTHTDGKVEFVKCENFNSVTSTAYDYIHSFGPNNIEIETIVRTVFVDEWEVLDNLLRPRGPDAMYEHTVEIGSASIQDSIQELLEDINRE